MPVESVVMMGKKDRSFAALSPVTLADLVPPDHFYRHLERTLDLGFVRDVVRDTCAGSGCPSIDPVVFFKLQLVMFFADWRSERQLIATASLNLAHRWCLGYALDEELPDHSSLTRIRQRLGIDIFQRFFEQIIDLCQNAGLVWGRELYLVATHVRADADADSLVPRFYADANTHVTDNFAHASVSTNEQLQPPKDGLLRLPATRCRERGGSLGSLEPPRGGDDHDPLTD
jgi:transposase